MRIPSRCSGQAQSLRRKDDEAAMRTIQALIFDMDGVIVDSELHWKSLEGYFLRTLIPGWTAADQGRIIGLSLDSLYDLLSMEYGLRGDKEEFLKEYHAIAEGIYTTKVSLTPGFLKLLALLHEKEVPVALASSSPRSWIKLVLDRFDLAADFKVVVSAQEVGGEGKPSPAIYLYTAHKLGVEPGGCVVIEDSRNGVLSARNAGMYCIGFRNGFNDEQDLSAADMVIEGFGGLDWATWIE
jgi:HAD superfamily hydrolase (TIGR01509 family)